jgi:hypothetical protein
LFNKFYAAADFNRIIFAIKEFELGHNLRFKNERDPVSTKMPPERLTKIQLKKEKMTIYCTKNMASIVFYCKNELLL